jgi:hypothetical protein
MEREGAGIRVGSEFRTLKYSEFVRQWANQYGTAHEAWRVTEHFLALRNAGVYVGAEAANIAILLAITKAVLDVADRFLAQVTDEAVAAAEKRRH